MAVTRDTLRLADVLRDQLDGVVDNQTRDLVRAWAEAWDEVAPDLQTSLTELATAAEDGRITRAAVLRSSRLQQSLAVIADNLSTLATDAGVRITGDLDGIVNAAGRAQEDLVATQLPTDERELITGWDRVDDRQITAIVQRATEQITALTYPISNEAYDAVRRELVRGIAAGANPRATASRMVRRVEGRFNGGLNRALVISRTETLDAHRNAAMISHQANADVLAGWVWTCQLDRRSCPACFAMHGSIHEVTEPGPLGHQQCRCARTPKVKSWADLGIDVDEPADLTPDAVATFEAMSDDDKLAVLGQSRYDAWKRGDYPMDAWARRRSTDGWRDSYVPSTPPSGGRPAARLAS